MTIEQNSLVSVIIPTYNAQKFIAEAIDSILCQSYENIEIIVVDDGSTDSTKELVTNYDDRVYYYYQNHKGLSSALNRGLELAKGEFIAFLDADDLWLPNKLILQISKLQEDSKIEMVFGQVKHFFSTELTKNEREQIFCPKHKMPGYSKTSMVIKRNSMFRVGLFSPKYSTGEFIDWYIRSQEIGVKGYLIPELVTMRRIHRNNMTKGNEKMKHDYARLLRNAIIRKRNNT